MKPRHIIAIAVLFIVAAISGCGGDDEDGTPEQVTREPQEKREQIEPRHSRPSPQRPQKACAGESPLHQMAKLYTMKPDGSDRTNLTNHKAIDNNPVWSPDGQTNRFSVQPNRRQRLRLCSLCRADGSKPRQITDWRAMGTLDFRPAWGPDGRIHPENMMAWSPDGRRIAFIDGNVVRIQVGDEVTIITKVRSNRPAWSPDGKRIAYQARAGEERHRSVGDIRNQRRRDREHEPDPQPDRR